MLSVPLSERFSSVLRLTNVGPPSETRFTPFEVLTPSLAVSPTLLTRRLLDKKSMLKLLHFGEGFFCLFVSFMFGKIFSSHLTFFGEGNAKMSLDDDTDMFRVES